MKDYVAYHNNCSVKDVQILSILEKLGQGKYKLCVNGLLMDYQRTGNVFHRKGVKYNGESFGGN
jgi:hypothetical protein